MNKDEKVIVITGTSKGIGRYLSEYYLKKNLLVIGCSRSVSDLQDINYKHFCLDVANEHSVKKMISNISVEYGQIDYLINNAGIASMNHSFLTPLSVLENVFKTNVFGTFLFCREVGKIMAKKKFGRIVNFATVATPIKLEGESVYAASKAAVITLTEILAREYAEYGITVNSIAPPAIQTDLVRGVPKDKMDNLLLRQAIHRFGHASEVRNVLDFLIKEESEMVTGQTIYLGGI